MPYKTAVLIYERSHWFWWIASFSLLLVFALLGTFKAPLGDFGNYYYGAKMLWLNQFDLSVYEPSAFNLALAKFNSRVGFLNYTPVPPITAIFYLPLVGLSPLVAKLVFNLLGVVALLISLFRLSRQITLGASQVFLSLVILLFPLKSNFDQGQTYALIAAALIIGFQYVRSRETLAVTLFSVAALLKIFPAIVFGYCLVQRQLKVIVMGIGVSLLLLSMSLLFIDSSIWETYVIEILPRLMKGEINNPFSTNYQSTTVFLKQLFVYDAWLNPNPIFHSPIFFKGLDLTIKVVLAYLLLNWILFVKSDFSRFAIVLFSGLMLSGYGSTYGFLLGLPMVVFLLTEQPKYWGTMIGLVGLACSSQLVAHFSFLEGFTYVRLTSFLMIVLIAAISIRYSLHAKWLALPAILIWVLLVFQKPEEAMGKLISIENPELLNTDLLIRDQKIVLRAFNGKNSLLVLDQFHPASDGQADFETIDHRIFWKGQPITPKHFWSKSPILLKDGILLFLSDQGRGVGFYAVRTMKLDPS